MMMILQTLFQHYDVSVWKILAAMVITGAGRTLAVKSLYQSGFDNAFVVTLLCLLGESLGLFVHWFQQRRTTSWHCRHFYGRHKINCIVDNQESTKNIDNRKQVSGDAEEGDDHNNIRNNNDSNQEKCDNADYKIEGKNFDNFDIQKNVHSAQLQQEENEANTKDEDIKCDIEEATTHNFLGGSGEIIAPSTTPKQLSKSVSFRLPSSSLSSSPSNEKETSDNDECTKISALIEEINRQNCRGGIAAHDSAGEKKKRIGSFHGLSEDSKQAIQWVHKIPNWFKPFIPAIFNLCNSLLRWASLLYISASIAEMLISGSELVLSALAGRIFRKRHTSWLRWRAIAVVTSGIIIIGTADILINSKEEENVETPDEEENSNHRYIGILLLLGQSVMSVLQDLIEEIFMQESELPPMLLLGSEGLIGLIIGLAVYFPFIEYFHDDVDDIHIHYEWKDIMCFGGLVLVFSITGIFNIQATAVTSSISRNVWKNFLTILVWVIGLVIFYSIPATSGENIGEEWFMPESFIVLFGFIVLLSGSFMYYWPEQE